MGVAIICIIEILLILLSIFVPTMYRNSWKYGSIDGVGSVYDEGAKNSFSLVDKFGWINLLFLLIIIFIIVTYLIMHFNKRKDDLIKILLYVSFVMPIVYLFIGVSKLKGTEKYMGNNQAIYGEGVSSGFTGAGWFFLFLLSFNLFMLIALLKLYKNEEESNRNNSIKEIKKFKKNSNGEIKIDDWKI